MSLSAIHEIEAVNAARLLPGVRLGYMMCDTCSHASKALQSVEHMLSICYAQHQTVCSDIDFRPEVKVFLGGLHSGVAISVSTLLNVYMIPLVSDKYLYLCLVFTIMCCTCPNECGVMMEEVQDAESDMLTIVYWVMLCCYADVIFWPPTFGCLLLCMLKIFSFQNASQIHRLSVILQLYSFTLPVCAKPEWSFEDNVQKKL